MVGASTSTSGCGSARAGRGGRVQACSGRFVMGAGLVGLIASHRNPHAWLVIALLLFFTAIHTLTFGLTRFRLPLMPFVILFASHAIVLGIKRWYAVRSRAA